MKKEKIEQNVYRGPVTYAELLQHAEELKKRGLLDGQTYPRYLKQVRILHACGAFEKEKGVMK